MRKVLYICPSSGIGGAETFIKQTCAKGNKTKYQNHYLLFRTGPLHKELEKQGATVHLLPHVPRLSSWADHQMVQKEIKSIVNQYDIHIVHSTMAYGALFTASICKKLQVPHVWFQHGPASGWMDRVAAVLPHNGLITNSHYTSQKQRELENPVRFFIPRKIPIEKILLGTDPVIVEESTRAQYRCKLLEDHHLPNGTILIAMLCRIQEWKGVHLFLDAIQKLKSESLLGFYCFVWGDAFKGSQYFDRLQTQIKKDDLPVRLLGASHNAPLSLSAVDIVVNASIQPEPFGLSIIEGMMMGAVPIVPNEGGPIEILNNGKDGLTFKARSPLSLAQQLRTLITDDELRVRLSQQAQLSARTKFNSERPIEQLELFYQKILQG